MIVVVSGVSGAGKTTVGRLVAEQLGYEFVEGDDYHSPECIAKMERGEPLTDAEREPWLERLAAAIDRWSRERRDVVLACSALKRSYRDRLVSGHDDVFVVQLAASREELRDRLEKRANHFMPARLLDSQIEILEPPAPEEGALRVDAEEKPEIVANRIVAKLTPHLRA